MRTIERHWILRRLDDEYQKLYRYHIDVAPRGLPVGGGEWIDSHFKLEAIRGATKSLREGSTIEESIDAGKKAGRYSVKMWNDKREWQVHRQIETTDDYIERLVMKYYNHIMED